MWVWNWFHIEPLSISFRFLSDSTSILYRFHIEPLLISYRYHINSMSILYWFHIDTMLIPNPPSIYNMDLALPYSVYSVIVCHWSCVKVYCSNVNINISSIQNLCDVDGTLVEPIYIHIIDEICCIDILLNKYKFIIFDNGLIIYCYTMDSTFICILHWWSLTLHHIDINIFILHRYEVNMH